MKYYGYSVNSGSKNMEIDSEILESSIASQEKEPIVRLYGWSPKCVSLGRNQKDDFLDTSIESVRRLTGGRALLHDNEITYCYVTPISIVPNGESVVESYKFISGILVEFFKTIGINLDFGENKKVSTNFDYCMLISTGADVCYKAKKLIGSAQCRKKGYILQHGSILYDYDEKLLESIFNEKVSGITCIKNLLPNMSKQEFINKLEQFLIKY